LLFDRAALIQAADEAHIAIQAFAPEGMGAKESSKSEAKRKS
jgi:hypothetical protein